MRFLNSIIKPDTAMSVGVVHPDPAAESLLAPQWVLCCVFTSVLQHISRLQLANVTFMCASEQMSPCQ